LFSEQQRKKKKLGMKKKMKHWEIFVLFVTRLKGKENMPYMPYACLAKRGQDYDWDNWPKIVKNLPKLKRKKILEFDYWLLGCMFVYDVMRMIDDVNPKIFSIRHSRSFFKKKIHACQMMLCIKRKNGLPTRIIDPLFCEINFYNNLVVGNIVMRETINFR
jgi:hypothetical protein